MAPPVAGRWPARPHRAGSPARRHGAPLYRDRASVVTPTGRPGRARRQPRRCLRGARGRRSRRVCRRPDLGPPRPGRPEVRAGPV